MPESNKKSQLVREYNQMIAKHQGLVQQQETSQVAHTRAEQEYFTASLEMSKLAMVEKQLLEDELATINEQKILSLYKKELEIEKIRKVETEILTRHQEQLGRDHVSEATTLRAMEESRKARSLAQERLRNRLEDSKSKAEIFQKTKEEDAQKRIRALLSLKQNYDSALAELKAANERRSKREQAQNEARLQETVTLLSQGLNPYEVFRQRELDQKKQKELNRIAAMAAKRRDEVRKLVAEDVRQYKAKKRASKTPQAHTRRQPPSPQHQRTDEYDSSDNDTTKKEIRTFSSSNVVGGDRSALRSSIPQQGDVVADLEADIQDRTRSPSKKMFSLNLPSVHEDKKDFGELYGLQSALSFASLASSALQSNRSSARELSAAGDFETSRSQRMDGERVSRRGGGERGERGERGEGEHKKTRPPKALSVLEQKMMERTMQSLKNNIVKKQVVMNKEFEGKSFITKPNILLFDDFQVGSSYTKKITVTNVSLSFNTFKVLELPAKISDFFKIVYAPPGRLSAGTGVTIDVTFTPALPTPISEKLVILAETGQFEIPIECLPKQSKVSLSTSHVEFDNISLGETQVKTVKVENKGGLESKLEISLDNDSCFVDSNAETFTDQDGNTRFVAETVQSDFSFNAIPLLKPYSCQSFEITFTPTALGTYSASILFRYIGPDNNPAVTRLLLTANVSDVPIYLSAREIDFRVCYCNQLYREALVLNNRSKIALKATVKVPNVLKKYVEFVPRVAFVQAHSSLSVQLKFKPTLELLDRSVAELMSSSATPTSTIEAMAIEPGENTSQDIMELDTSTTPAVTNQLPNNNLLPSCTISIPVTVEVATSHPVCFLLKATVTNPILTTVPSEFHFGECSINESVSIPFTVVNQGVTPVRYGFIHLPKEIQILPGDGFGTMLPLEEMQMVAMFSPITATEHTFSLTLKTDQGRIITIPCSGTGVKPSLQFNPAIITIPPTSLGDVNTTSVFLENISKVPQIFEICVPEDCPFLQITPVVQTINPGARTHIKIDFEPGVKLSLEGISSEKENESAAETTKLNGEQTSKALKPRSYSRKSSSRSISSSTVADSPSLLSSSPPPFSPPDSLSSHRASNKGASTDRKQRKKKAGGSAANIVDTAVAPSPKLLSKADEPIPAQRAPPPRVQPPQLPEGKTLTWQIPCFSKPAKSASSPKDAQPASGEGNLGVVVYLEISAVVAPPTLVRVLDASERSSSDSTYAPNPPVDFGQVPIGQSVVKKITIKNNSPNEIKPQLAAVYGNMTVLNAVRPMGPKQSQVLQIQYKPDSHGMHLETISLTVGKHHRLVVPVVGQGVSPKLTIDPLLPSSSPQHPPSLPLTFDLGHTIVKDSIKKEFKLINGSQFAVGYHIHLMRIGPKNLNGINPFSVIPSEGDVPVGGEKIITISFEPDHENQTFHDELQIEVKSETVKRTIYLKGCCTGTRGMYLLDPLGDSRAVSTAYYRERNKAMGLSDVIKPGYNGCIPRGSLTLNFIPNESSYHGGPIVRSLVFGNAKVKREKGVNGEVIFEPLSPQGISAGFSMEGNTTRYTIEPDSSREIEFRFDPSANPSPGSKNKDQGGPLNGVENLLQLTVETSIKCTLKGGYSPQDKEGISFTIILVGHYSKSVT